MACWRPADAGEESDGAIEMQGRRNQPVEAAAESVSEELLSEAAVISSRAPLNFSPLTSWPAASTFWPRSVSRHWPLVS